MAAEAEFPASVRAKEELYHHQDHRCSFKLDPLSVVVRPREEKIPWPATKFLLSALRKA